MENKQVIKMCALSCEPECKEIAHVIGTIFGLMIAPIACAGFWFFNYKINQSNKGLFKDSK